MNVSKPSTVVGGGEMNRDTSSVVSSAKSDGASDGAQLAQRDLPPRSIGSPLPPIAAGDRLRSSDHDATAAVQLVAVRHVFHG